MTALLVVLGAAVGAPLRYLVDRAVQARHRGLVPWGTFAVNVVGSLVLGALAGAGSVLPGPVCALVGTGFCGALTTYSTFGYETVRLVERGARRHAVGYVVLSVVAGLGAAALGFAAARALVG
ncbi:fluoride efflux transporter CrcB [Actinophytocola gossypii]|uniref:Fluoride-specific ion channel FluC n=1 Tax=Actinophytocola gossypii TaxID=2812003 RepID=A0ABT2JAA4_9PSEU|nr:fluoride efflux transporter CrcB [Actinophytocola gossypii]MCT2584395.1 fluoride efflux transporter CrcB [Actinophytocola gossypii]